MMKLNKEIEFQKKVFGDEGAKLPVSLLDENNEVLVTTIGFDDFEKLMNWMGYMEKEIKWVISGTYDNPYAKYVLDEGIAYGNE